MTLRHYEHPLGHRHVWVSRSHRKDLQGDVHGPHVIHVLHQVFRCLWRPWRLNWWIGVVFAIGASLFAVGSAAALLLSMSGGCYVGLPDWLNLFLGLSFFIGSIPFTTAAYLQLYQAANMPEISGETLHRMASNQWQMPKRRWFGWQPKNAGWLSCALQFPGTLLFNLNTFGGLLTTFSEPSSMWLGMVIWMPNLVGSVLFLMSGWLAFVEVCHAHWAWRPTSLSWWIAVFNLAGCVGFMVSAIAAMPWSATAALSENVAMFFTCQGALGFFIGSLLMLPEDAAKSD